MHQEDPAPAVRELAQRMDDGAVQGIFDVVVADPVIEQITEDVERARATRLLAQETEEDPADRLPIGSEVQIGDEQDRGAASISVRNGALAVPGSSCLTRPPRAR
jgi:hypothetical protein